MSMMIRRGKKRAAKAVPLISYEPLETKPVSSNFVTKEEVEKMPYFSLKSLATKNGIKADGKKKAALVEEIVEKLNL